jgi:hypothetical protein
MAQWDWLTKPETLYSWRFVRNVVIKGLALFVVANTLFALLNPAVLLGRISAYNRILPGRDRLPYAENPDQSYNLSLLNLDAMFSAHQIAGTPKAADEYRVLLIGDSSVWGVLLKPDETLAAYLNAANYRGPNGKRVRVYNVGYPIQSLMKDVLLLQYAMRYQPDLIVWMLTLESFAPNQQFESLLVRDNPEPVRQLISVYKLKIDPNDPGFTERTFVDRTIVGQRRPLADLLRLQLYGADWAITRIDQRYPKFYEPRMENFGTDVTWQGFQPQTLTADKLAFDVLRAGFGVAGQTPVILINEPIFISSGVNSDLRYDFFYPRWAYDAYRDLMAEQVRANGWNYTDLWNIISPDQFTDSAVHVTPRGSKQLADRVGEIMMGRPSPQIPLPQGEGLDHRPFFPSP